VRWPRVVPAVPVCAALLVLTSSAAYAATSPWTEPLPWTALDAEPAFVAGLTRLEDDVSGWRIDAAEIMHIGVRGEKSRWFLRWTHLAFSTSGNTALVRWPELAGGDAGPDWPGESRIAGWGRPEIGLLDRAHLPGLGEAELGFAASLPFAANALYPFAASCTTLRAHLRRGFALGGGLRVVGEVGRVIHTGAAGDELHDDAFGSRTLLGGGLEWRGATAACSLGMSRLGDDAERLAGGLDLSLGDGVGLRIEAARDLAAADDRQYRTRIGVSLRIRGLGGPDGGGPAPAGGRAGEPPYDDGE
jgi:hypothetical protein